MGVKSHLVDHKREIAENMTEGALALIDHTEFNFALEEQRRNYRCGEQRDEVSVERGEEVQVPAGDQEVHVVLDSGLEALWTQESTRQV